jgi:hypothetical protein
MFLAQSIKNMILNPSSAWDTIHTENKSVSYLVLNLFLPLIFTVAVAAFLGSYIFTKIGLNKAYAILTGIRYLLLYSLTIYGTSFIFNEITNASSLGRNFSISFKIIGYSVIPLLICQIVSRLFESFIFVNVLAFFGLYICWTGIEKLLDPQGKKKLLLLFAATAAFIILFIAVNSILSFATEKLYFAFFD